MDIASGKLGVFGCSDMTAQEALEILCEGEPLQAALLRKTWGVSKANCRIIWCLYINYPNAVAATTLADWYGRADGAWCTSGISKAEKDINAVRVHVTHARKLFPHIETTFWPKHIEMKDTFYALTEAGKGIIDELRVDRP